MLGVHPYISFQGNCREAIEFYKTALSASVLYVQTFGESPMSSMGPAENIMHCSIRIGESTIMMCDDPNPGTPSTTGIISLAIGTNEPERAHQLFTNLSEGGLIVMPMQKTYWAEVFGMVTDRFGVKWMVNCEAPRTNPD